MDTQTLLAALEFSRARLLASIETIEKSGQDTSKVLSWRPGPGRAHIAWQLMHCAATHDRYLNAFVLGGKPKDEALVNGFAGGSTPSDQEVPDVSTIKNKLETTFADFKGYIAGLQSADLEKVVGPAGRQRKIGDAVVLMAWHEAHHQGQVHLTWNLYKAAHNVT